MAKKKLLLKIWMWVVGVFSALAIAGLFVNGQTLTAPILSIFPLSVHTLVGWGIVISVVIGAIIDLVK
jgi:hypothetical protein